MGKPVGPVAHLGECGLGVPVAGEGDDLAVGMNLASMSQDRLDGELVIVLHRAVQHERLP